MLNRQILRTLLMHKFLLLICLFLSAYASADIFNAGEFRLIQGEEENSFILTAQLPTVVIKSTELRLPKSCEMQMTNNQAFGNKSQLKYEFTCNEAFSQDAEIITPWNLDGATFQLITQERKASLVLKRSLNTMVIPLSELSDNKLTKVETIKRYFWQGILHIWFGWDHLAFVMCLCLLARGYKLLKLVTAFTVGHSVTLALSFYQVVSVAIAPIEVLIAFSIVLMAREAFLHQTSKANNHQSSRALGTSTIVAILFGLIHGLGFASALEELGVPQNEIGLALLFFNIGIEAGQVMFILAISLLSQLTRNEKIKYYSRNVALFFVGSLGAFWSIERVAGF
jgi:hydrogenase/urease accessory protein HupE